MPLFVLEFSLASISYARKGRLEKYWDGSAICILSTRSLKQLQVNPKKLFDLMSHSKWIYRRIGSVWIGYQDKIQQNLLEHKVSVVKNRTGEDKQVSQVRVTAKGLSKLAKLLSVEVMAWTH
ncbi:phage antirepressor KilAC domain-containing protein [Providencia huaxiensis]|nr:phage antirepressor KilAC domain-containing protein [Providencia huaxiensis]MDI7241697.1 phage antirepressor KilAC domain-containing protein [Providencia huaxiensis]